MRGNFVRQQLLQFQKLCQVKLPAIILSGCCCQSDNTVTGVSCLAATMAATLVKRRPTVRPNEGNEK